MDKAAESQTTDCLKSAYGRLPTSALWLATMRLWRAHAAGLSAPVSRRDARGRTIRGAWCGGHAVTARAVTRVTDTPEEFVRDNF